MSRERLVDKFLILDAHNDSIILRQVHDDPMDFSDVNPRYVVDLPRLREGGIDCMFVMVGDKILQQSLTLIDAMHEMCRKQPETYSLCLTQSDVRKAYKNGKIAIVLSIEGQSMFNEKIEDLRNWYRLGVRVASLTHGRGRRPWLQFTPAYRTYLTPWERENHRRQAKGLTPFAYEVIKEMTRLNIVLDIAHVNDAAFWEVMELDECPPLSYTHGGCYAVCPHARCMTDEMMKAFAKKGGVMGITFVWEFIDKDNPTLDKLCDHFIHALEVIGPDHVGIGTDFDGTSLHLQTIPPDVSKMEDLFQALAKRGVDEKVLGKIAGENFLKLMQE